MTDGEGSESGEKIEEDTEPKPTAVKQAEIIGHKEDSGELVVVVKGKGRGRPKGKKILVKYYKIRFTYVMIFDY